ncbi:MAG TPA: triphosphoribosyl-dephospho-CoA synthase, partial [Candidatus Polarisedimenticolia bacterium]|nr:triphosphoribosyl-dephospho-CoA synthase [Candidatus Polarisedimenticolia bacterium]
APTVTTGGGTPITAATLRHSLARVLRRLDRRDARDAYRAIRLARPGGLGRVREQDIASPPTRSLLECMRLASAHDAIAREYATDYAVTFEAALPALRRLRAARLPAAASIAQTYLELLASRPDSLITRRHGAAAALRVSREAKRVIGAGGLAAARGRRLAARLDRRLRAARPPLNPGATADLTVAALFAWLLLRSSGSRSPRRGSSRAPR